MSIASTTFKLSSGANGRTHEDRYFPAFLEADAWVRFSERLLDLDRDPEIDAAWVSMERLPDSIYPEGQHLAAWTKCSNEGPTSEGTLAP